MSLKARSSHVATFVSAHPNLALGSTKNKATSTTLVNSGSGPVNTQHADQDDSDMSELIIFNKPQKGIFDEASYDDKGMDSRRSTSWSKDKEDGINYDEVFAPVAKIEAIRLFLAFASFMGFIVYQIDVKSAFLYGTIDEEVYVSQPPGFVDPDHPKKVYKVVKALYGLHQAPRAWYATLSTFLEKHGYRRGTIDKTLFIKKDKKDIMLVQVYVDDIIFGSTRKSWCDEFKALMKGIFQMSSMGELIFFLGLQVKQKTDGIFISQDKPDIMFAVCACSRFQVTPKTSHLNAVKRIFKYLKGKPNLGLWYPRESSFDLEASSSDFAGQT
ncbi:putative ribonuclease H-like domain-containing protein [Tanacetum coccineum]